MSLEEHIVKGRSGDKFVAGIVQEMRVAQTLPDSMWQSELTRRLQDAADKMYGRTTLCAGIGCAFRPSEAFQPTVFS